jgi:ABC-2 type transport system ATP-binding protein
LASGRLHRLPWPVVRERSARLLEIFDLGGAGKKAVKTYSGGMRRKLDLALGLMAEPRSCSLTSPPPAWTGQPARPVGHHPRPGETRDDRAADDAVPDEADALAGSVVFIDVGRVVVAGTPADSGRSGP